jgi:hypothetical protein
LDKRPGGPQSRSGRGGEEKNSQTLPGIEPPIILPVAQPTELSVLHEFKLFTVLVIPILLYGCEIYALKQSVIRRLKIPDTKFMRQFIRL